MRRYSDLPTLDPVMDVERVADAMSVHHSTVRRLIRRGALAAIRLSPRRIGVRESEVRRYLREGFDGGAA